MKGLRFVSTWMMVVAAIAVVGACGDDDSSPTGVGIPENAVFDAALGVDLAQMTKLASGVYIQDLVVGTGAEAGVGDEVFVGYSGWLPNGTLFDRRLPANPFSFTIGQAQVILGWERGVPGMKEGGIRKLVIPADQAYGAQGRGSIPPNSVLVFDVELVQVGR